MPETLQALVIEVGGRLCALPTAHVVETMRPLPLEVLPGAPPFVAGVAVIRGAPVPVVDLRALLGEPTQTPPGRFVTVEVEGRRVALAVDAVAGLRPLATTHLETLPPLLRDLALVEAIGTADARFLLVLRAARLLPPEAAP